MFIAKPDNGVTTWKPICSWIPNIWTKVCFLLLNLDVYTILNHVSPDFYTLFNKWAPHIKIHNYMSIVSITFRLESRPMKISHFQSSLGKIVFFAYCQYCIKLMPKFKSMFKDFFLSFLFFRYMSPETIKNYSESKTVLTFVRKVLLNWVYNTKKEKGVPSR